MTSRPHLPSPAAALIAASGAFAMVSLDVTIVNVALPTLQAQLGATLQGLQWVVDGYALVFAAGLLTGGALGDTLGARRVFAIGLALFALASAGCGLAASAGALIAARFAQGVGAALLMPCSLALLRAAFADEQARARAVAVWAAAGGGAVAAGPVIGGLLIDTLGWRSIFLINLALGAAILGLTVARVPVSERRHAHIDTCGQVAAVAAVGGLTFAVVEGPRLGWSAPSVTIALVVAVTGAAGFVSCERRAASPMLPPALARRRSFVGAALVGALLNCAFYGQVFVLSLFFQHARHQTPLQAGLSFLPMTALITVANLAAPRVARRVGPLRTIIGGQVVMAAGLIAVATVDAHTRWWALALALLPIGVGGGLTIPPLTHQLLESVPAQLAGVASGALNASRQLGGAIGVAGFGALLAAHSADFTAGMHLTGLAAAAATLAGAPLAATLLSPRATLRTTQPLDTPHRPPQPLRPAADRHAGRTPGGRAAQPPARPALPYRTPCSRLLCGGLPGVGGLVAVVMRVIWGEVVHSWRARRP
jgi:MFS transporter, DHA2 family, methylenomycin A resistance protein